MALGLTLGLVLLLTVGPIVVYLVVTRRWPPTQLPAEFGPVRGRQWLIVDEYIRENRRAPDPQTRQLIRDEIAWRREQERKMLPVQSRVHRVNAVLYLMLGVIALAVAALSREAIHFGTAAMWIAAAVSLMFLAIRADERPSGRRTSRHSPSTGTILTTLTQVEASTPHRALSTTTDAVGLAAGRCSRKWPESGRVPST